MATERTHMEDDQNNEKSSQAPKEEKIELGVKEKAKAKAEEEVKIETKEKEVVEAKAEAEVVVKVEDKEGQKAETKAEEEVKIETKEEEVVEAKAKAEAEVVVKVEDKEGQKAETKAEEEVKIETKEEEIVEAKAKAEAKEEVKVEVSEEIVEEVKEKDEAEGKEAVEVKVEIKDDKGKEEVEAEVELKTEESSDESKEAEEEVEQEEEHDEEYDFTEYTKEQIVDFVKELSKWESPVKAERVLRDLKTRYDEIHEVEKAEALKLFVEGGGEEEGFQFQPDHNDEEFDANFKLIRDRKYDFRKNQERSKQDNLAKAEDILDRLREFIDSSESSSSFKKFKEFQDEWKALGSFPSGTAKSLWANYNALVSRFYDARSIYFELKELDRKKNLELKLDLCKKAEELAVQEDLNDAIMQLNELHHEFKHIGPVPSDQQEALWLRFKAASDQVYARRKEANVHIKAQLKDNEEKKLSIIDKIKPYFEFQSDRIKEWNSKTKEVLQIQKEWEAVGPIPKETAKEINKQFWSNFKGYFNNKNHFFKGLEKQRQENLVKKEELVAKADELKESQDWEGTAKQLKQLQKDWREIGPVPEKVRNEVYQRFKDACDHFFNQRRSALHVSDKDFEDNLKKKESIVKDIDKLTKDSPNDMDALHKLVNEYYEIGFVPKSEIKSILNKFNTAVDEYLGASKEISSEEKDQFKMENKLEKLKHSPNADRKIHQKEQSLRKQITHIENDISVWRNNIEFFSNTKNGEKYRDEFGSKIDEANEELNKLKKELRMLRTN